MWEGLFIDVDIEKSKQNTIIGNIYRPPKFSYNFCPRFQYEFARNKHQTDITSIFRLIGFSRFYPKIMQPTRFTKC